ncbi:kinetochore-associated protein 1 isoform X2 [Prorops nasuta]|uniref:kinetochore-associated protein 1 isoform X2 n=1 Tax=Prorops nasuta TaxID=863751 RepID=UPI0034CF6485
MIVFDGPVKDFVIIESQSSDQLQVLLLMMPVDNNVNTTLCLMTLPGFVPTFQIKVPNSTYLIDIPIDFCGEIPFLEDNFSEETHNIRLKALIENDPEYHLQRLLRKQKFKEAFIFAEKCQLSTESIYCAKVAFYLTQFDPWIMQISESTMNLDLLINDLDKINDIEYVANCCTKVLLSDYTQMKKIFLYAQHRIVQSSKEITDKKRNKLLSLINNTIHKFETFDLIKKCQLVCSSSSGNDQKADNDWATFARADLLEECKKNLCIGNLETAALIWTRHFPDFVTRLSKENITNFLQGIPKNESTIRLLSWLSHFIPSLLISKPDTLPIIVDWAYKRTESLEEYYKTSWPEIGVEFMRSFMKLLNFKDNCGNQDMLLKQFMQLQQTLNELQELKLNHNIKISLIRYMSEPMRVAHALLQNVHTEGLPYFINTFLKRYMLQNFLENDTVLTIFIKKLIINSKSWWDWEQCPWVEKIVGIVPFIQAIEARLLLVLEILKSAPVPWSFNIHTLAEVNSKMNHPLASKIKIEINCLPIKLILKKYRFEKIGICGKLISRIIKEKLPDMLEDIDILTKNDLSMRRKAFFECAVHFLIEGTVDEIANAFSKLKENNVIPCYDAIINYISINLIKKEFLMFSVNCLECLGWIENKIQNACNIKAYIKNNMIVKIGETRSLYYLKKEFEITISTTEYYDNKQRILQNGIDNLVEKITSKGISLLAAFKKVSRLAYLLQLKKMEGWSLLLQRTQDKDLLKIFIDDITSLTIKAFEVPYLQEVCIFMLKNSELNGEIIEDLKSLCNYSLSASSVENLEKSLIIHNWLRIFSECGGNQFVFTAKGSFLDETSKDYKIYEIYKGSIISSKSIALPLLKSSFLALDYSTNDIKLTPNSKNIAITASNMQEEANKLLADLLEKISNISINHIDYQMLLITLNIYRICCCVTPIDQNKIKSSLQSVAKFGNIVFKKYINSRSFDFFFGLFCLSLASTDTVYNWIKPYESFQADYTRHTIMCTLPLEYARLINDKALMQLLNYRRNLYSWTIKLNKFKISEKEILESDNAGRREILGRIMIHNQKDCLLQLLEDFCASFCFDTNDCLLLYLQTSIEAWNPTLDINAAEEKNTLHVSNEEVEQLKQKCYLIISKISDKSAVNQFILNLLPQVNFYYYEVIIILMDLLKKTDTENRSYLSFLKNYTRYGTPTEVEIEEWVNINPRNPSLPIISKWRLPFLPKINKWKLITPELNFKTYRQWLKIAPVLNLPMYMICILSIKGEAASAWKDKNMKEETDKWPLQLQNSSLLKQTKECLQCITETEELFFGSAALFFVVNQTPPGADKVAAAEECFAYAQEAIARSAVFDDVSVQKIKCMYLTCKSKHILRTHNLYEKYISLINSPSKLIYGLYMDESIPLRYRIATDHKPDINSAVKALSEVFSLNLVKIQLDLVEEWLQPTSKFEDATNNFMNVINLNSVDDDNLLRACYILEDSNLHQSVYFLINIGFNDNEGKYSLATRYRALCVLKLITDEKLLEELTKQDINYIRKYTKSLNYLSELENFGLSYSVHSLATCSKEEIIQILQKLHYSTPQTLIFTANLCLDFDIHDICLWNKTLDRMSKLSLVNELKKIILQVRHLNDIVNSDGYALAWQTVISEPFQRLDSNITCVEMDDCIAVLHLLYSCPIISKLSFTSILKYCFQYNRPSLAAALLPFLESIDKTFAIQRLKDLPELQTVIDSLQNLLPKGIFTASYSIKIIKEIVSEPIT